MNTRPELIAKLQTALSKCDVECETKNGVLVFKDGFLFTPYLGCRMHDALFLVDALDLMESWGFSPILRRSLLREDELKLSPGAKYEVCLYLTHTSVGYDRFYGPDRAHAVAEALLAVATQRALPSMAIVEGE